MIRTGFKALKGMVLGKLNIKIPLHVSYMCTFRCNLHCKFCGWPARAGKELTTGQAKQAIKEFAELGCVAFGFSGGEPLLRKDIDGLILYAKKQGMLVNINTNGILVKDHLEALKNVDVMVVSVDGPREIHDYIRGKGVFDKAVEAVKLAKNNNINVVVESVLSDANLKNNADGLRKMFRLVKELDCKFLVQPLYFDDYNKDMKIGLNQSDYLNGLRLLKRFKKEHPVLLSNSELDWYEQLNSPRARWDCYAGKLFCVMYPDGTLYPCNILENEGVSGLKYGFKKAFTMLKSKHSCKCWLSCYTKYNNLFSLRPDTVLSEVKQLL